VLVITVWASAEAGGELRLRVVSNTDVISGVEHRFHSTEPEEVLGQVRAWLADFAAHQSGGAQVPGDAGVTRARQSPVSLIRDGPAEQGRGGGKGET
jgi:hypothetical protein